MALGDVTTQQGTYSIELLASATADNGQPSGTSAGIAVEDMHVFGSRVPDVATFMLASTAGTGTLVVDLKIWGYSAVAGAWMPLGTGTGGVTAGAGIKGMLNDGITVAEVEANSLVHTQVLDLPGHFERLYLELLNIGGTSTAVTAWLTWESKAS